MKYLFLFFTSLFLLSAHAEEINTKEFPLILPISLEKADNSLNNYFADTDNDGVSDDKDKCQKTKANAKVDLFGCIILNDDDYDGVSNRDDKCPKTEADATVNLNGCEPDNDADSVPDVKDKCPDTEEGFLVDKDGCPQTKVLQVHFKTKGFTIDDDSLPEVEEFAFFLLDNKEYQAIIYGYTDNVGKMSKNKELSQKRASAIVDALISFGVKLTRLTAIGMGPKNPIAENSTPEGRTKNRRIEVELLQ